ncbi:MAG: hypothetical protein JOZ42_14750 [Acetobacteraceae bacterium]|nr:hypothetical protein [Acetobacteraceae bacterium]
MTHIAWQAGVRFAAAGLILAVVAPDSSVAQTPFPLGLYTSPGPNGNDRNGEAAFERDFDNFVKLMGTRPQFVNAYTDNTQGDPNKGFVGSAGWMAWSWKRTGDKYIGPNSGVIPVIGLAMSMPGQDWGNVNEFYVNTLSGQWDRGFRGIVDQWADNGYKTLYVRISYEFNGTFMAWSPLNAHAPDAVRNFAKAWGHIADLVHAEGKARGITVKTVWNPAAMTPNQDNHIADCYPGDDKVDLVGIDIYSSIWTPDPAPDWSKSGGQRKIPVKDWIADNANRAHFWQYTNAQPWQPQPVWNEGIWGWSFQNMADFARAHGKPMGVWETGSGNGDKEPPFGPHDDPYFVEWLAGALTAARASGVTIGPVMLWNDDVWHFTTPGERPGAAAAWARYFGREGRRAAADTQPPPLSAGR